MSKFKLLRSIHVGTHPKTGESHTWRAKDPANNVVETDIDLVARFGHEKFVLLEVEDGSNSASTDLLARIEALETENAALKEAGQEAPQGTSGDLNDGDGTADVDESESATDDGEGDFDSDEGVDESESATDDGEGVDLMQMSTVQLKQFADGEEINITGLRKKDDLIAAIQKALEEEPELA